MIVLALDSTTPAGSVALARIHLTSDERSMVVGDGERFAVGHQSASSSEPRVVERAGDARRSWSERLPADLLELLSEHGLRPTDVDIFAVASGPGSLTGLRVGIATVQGFAFATGRPVAAISALDALAEHGWQLLDPRAGAIGVTAHDSRVPSPEPRAPSPASRVPDDAADAVIGAWTNAMRGEVFTGLYAPRAGQDAAHDPWERLGEPAVAPPDVAAAAWLRAVGPRQLHVVGDVQDASGEALREAFGVRVRLHPRPLIASILVTLALRQRQRGALVHPHAVRPTYVRKPDAVLARERVREDDPTLRIEHPRR